MRSEQEANAAIEKYADTIRRICFVHLKNYHDAEDIFQNVFLKYVLSFSLYSMGAREKNDRGKRMFAKRVRVV